MTEKTNSLTSYRAWRRYIGDAELKLEKGKKGHQRVILVAVAERIARHGANGIGCYPSNETIARELDITRVTVDKYKDLAIELGWFTDTGKRRRRIPVLDIAIPGEPEAAAFAAPDSNAEPDPWGTDETEPDLDQFGGSGSDPEQWRSILRS